MAVQAVTIKCPKKVGNRATRKRERCGKPATEYLSGTHDRRGGPTRCHWFRCEDGHVSKIKAKR